MYNIYAFLDNGKITCTNEGDFEITSDGWQLVWSGEEKDAPDLFPKGLMTERGGFIYSLIDGKVVERTAEEIAADEEAANPAPTAPMTDAPTWDELAAALQEGVDAV